MAIQLSAQKADRTKLSPMLIDRMTQSVATARGTEPVDEEYVLALVKLTDGDVTALTRRGCRIVDSMGTVYVALLPVSQLAPLSLDQRVVRMEANPLSRPLTDVTRKVVGADLASQGVQLPQAYTGRGVVVGVCDVGLDFTNPMFNDANGQTRIRQAWDIYTGENTGYAGFGTLYTTPEQLVEARGTCDSTRFHGTHVAAIAAGSAVGGYQGIASEADIVMSLTHLNGCTDEQKTALINSVNATLSDDTADPLIRDVVNKKLTLSNAMEALAVKHVVDYAKAHGQPCVVNCSFGAQQTLATDYSLQEELMNSLTGPGRIIVCSAGNYSDGILHHVKQAHTRMNERMWLKSSLTPTITLRSAGRFTLKLLPDIEGADTLRLTSEAIVGAGDDGYEVSADINNDNVLDKFRVEARAYTLSSTPLTAFTVTLRLPTPTRAYTTPSFAIVIEGDAEVEVMGASNAATFNRLNATGYAKNAPYTVTVPAAFKDMIAVGLTSHRDSVTNIEGNRITYEYNNNALGTVVSWSGTGPTLEGRTKPDVVAPGHNIVSAFNGNCQPADLSASKRAQLVAKERIANKDYYWKAESGTSMAAPVVTGTVALWLQANPQLTPGDVKAILAITARHPEADETYPNCRYGNGEIDAYRGLLYINGLTGIEGLSAHQPRQLSFRLSGRTLILAPLSAAAVPGAALPDGDASGTTAAPSGSASFPAAAVPGASPSGSASAAAPSVPFTVTIYAIGGQSVLRAHPADGTVDLSSLRPGIYAVQVDSGEAATTGSTLIRLQ